MARAAAAAVQTALDCESQQCLVDFFNDPAGLKWHHRLLLVEGDGGQWIAATPDYDVELLDLTNHRVVPLGRSAVVERTRAAESYMFDPLDDGDEAMLMDQARALARLVGFRVTATSSAGSSVWRLSDPSHDRFGSEVPIEALNYGGGDEVVTRGDIGLVKVDGGWTVMERVSGPEEKAWLMSKTTGCGRDRRVLPWSGADPRGGVVVPRSQSLAFKQWNKADKPVNFPLDGPPLLPEYFEGLEEAGLTLMTHHQGWVRTSGVSEHSSAARWHRSLTEAIRLLGFVDQLDLPQVVGAEYLCREVMKVEIAVERNPKVPDWDGLASLTGTRLSETGGVHARKFMQWVGTMEKDKAFVMKQGRQYREEQDALLVKKKKGGKNNKGDKPDGDG